MNNPNPNTATHKPLIVVASGVEPLPVGAYLAEFQSVQPFSNEKVQGKLRWCWKVISGANTGRDATALTDPKITLHTHAGRLATGILNRAIVVGEDLSASLHEQAGKRYMVVIGQGTKGGKPSVQSCSLPPEM